MLSFLFRGEYQQGRATHEATRWAVDSNLSEALPDGRHVQDVSESRKAAESEGAVHSSQHHVKWTEKHAEKKVVCLR